MSLTSPTIGEAFTLRIYKQTAGVEWANTYELVVTNDTTTYNDLEVAAAQIVSAERSFHLTEVFFDRYVLSTYVQDGTPYNPLSFTSVTVAQYGNRSIAAQRLSYEVCLFVRKRSTTGRTGKAFYRGVLVEQDVDGVISKFFVDGVLRNTVQTNLNPLVSTLPAGVQLSLVSGVAPGLSIRPVVSFECAQNASIKQLRNRRRTRSASTP